MKIYELLAKFLKNRGRYRAFYRTLLNGKQQLYLERWYIIRTKRFGLFLHKFSASDEDPVHDHPWNNFSWILSNGYWEYLPDGQKLWRNPGFKKFRAAEEFHRIELEKGSEGKVWTLFGRFKRRRKWGFWFPTGWIAADPTRE